MRIKNKPQIKEDIKKLIERYRQLTPDEIKKYNEANTRKNFILPLFEALGWDTKSDEVVEEERASGKRVDYGFKIGGITKFFLEAKPLSADLDIPKWADQAIWYAWHKSIPWVILSDFESIKVFNAEWETSDPESSLFFEMKLDKYLDDFERLWWLSKESFEKGVLDEEALKWGKKPKRIPVDKQLSQDLIDWRDKLHRELKPMDLRISSYKLAESIQRILDRLIFIRTVEDRGVEDYILQPLIRSWVEAGRPKNKLLTGLRDIFRKFDNYYNSRLFENHYCDQLKAIEGTFEEIINELYKTKRGIRYNFDHINADVLGSIYEQYLGKIQKEEKHDKKLNGKTKRKSQGIYYTPRYIVDYIVQNALGEILKEKNPEEIKSLRILDPACGSGSFLIRAYEEFINYWETKLNKESKFKKDTHLGMIEKTIKQREGRKTLSAEAKMNVLRNNIYGVDLDEQAVEIAQLNLLLKTVNRRVKLPNLQHILCGNSLISGEEKELKKYFGKKWEDKKPFDWQEKLPEVFKGGGFDVIIGNPPWGANLNENEKLYFKENFDTGKGIIDTFALFIEKSFTLLRKDGFLGLILPDIILLKNYPVVRKLILDNFKILEIFYTGMAFKGVNLDSVVLILKKEKIHSDNLIKVCRSLEDAKEEKHSKINQSLFLSNKQYKFNLFLDKNNLSLKDKLERNSIRLSDLSEIHEGIHSGNIRNKLFTKYPTEAIAKRLIFKGVEVQRYSLCWNNHYVNYSKKIIDKKNGEYANLSKEIYFELPKILIRRTGDKIIAIYDTDKFYASNNFFTLNLLENIKLKHEFLLAILNSKLMTWYFNVIQPRKGKLFAEIKINHINDFPIYKIGFSEKDEKAKHDELVKLANKMLKLNKKLQKLHPVFNEEEYKEIKAEIEKTDKEIDEKVYKLYGLTPEEIEAVENFNIKK